MTTTITVTRLWTIRIFGRHFVYLKRRHHVPV